MWEIPRLSVKRSLLLKEISRSRPGELIDEQRDERWFALGSMTLLDLPAPSHPLMMTIRPARWGSA